MSEPQYSKRVYVAPFGRYEGTRPNEYPANEVLIGRERERARMVDWLLTFGNRGAYLVTGYRGVGKTSFVQFCVRQYEDDVYGRYLQTKAGRSLFWDRIAVCCVVALVLFVPVALSQVLGGLWGTDWTRWYFLRWLIAVPLGLIALYPLVRALLLFSRSSSNPDLGWDFWLVIGSLVLAVPLFLVGTSLSGPEAGGYFLAFLAWTYLTVNAASVKPESGKPGSLDCDPSAARFGGGKESKRSIRAWWFAGIFCLTGSAFLFGALRRPEPDPAALTDGKLVIVFLFAAALYGLLGLLLRWIDAGLLSRFMSASAAHFHGGKSAGRSSRTQRVMAALLLLGLAFATDYVVSNGHVPESDSERRGLLLIGLPAFLLMAWYLPRRIGAVYRGRGDDKPWFYFHPRPRLVLVVKAAFSFVLGLQILRDLLGDLKGRFPSLQEHLAGWVSTRRAFENLGGEVSWLALSATLIFFLVYLEHDWIARRHERMRQDDAYDRFRPEAGEYTRLRHLHLDREIARSTTFWSVFRTWLPCITVRVNLGFDDLSHTHVVLAMLGGLRNEYHRTFLAWRSRLALVWRIVGTGALVVAAIALGNAVQDMHLVASFLDRTVQLPMPQGAKPGVHLVERLLPSAGQGLAHELNGYHAVAFLLLAVLARLLGSRLGIPYHRSLHAKLTRMLESLSSTVRHVRRPMRLQVTPGMSFEESSESAEVDTPPKDPRTIEQEFLSLLRDIQEPYVPLPMAGHLLSLPAPQITFIFDELDKIGVRSAERAADDVKADATNGDRERSARIHRLLADLKNLLSTAPARFIFVGGRELHDEWLADLTTRQPLLSNVFDGEIYLPTLLSDRIDEGAGERHMLHGVYAYLNAQLSRTSALYERWRQRRRWGDSWFNVYRHEPEHFFVQEPDGQGPLPVQSREKTAAADHLSTWPLYELSSGKPCGKSPDAWHGDFYQQFSEYLAFRSRGNPKRMNGLIERFVRPVGRVVFDSRIRWSTFECQHVLVFAHVERFSIQLVANIYRRLQPVILARVDFGDDKIIRSALYLADFLLKFHRRAFSWSSLERIDELLHAHRAPDLRRVLSELLYQWSQCFVHPILEGMHAFRFRSEVAAEVRYISRCSESEMATFNFTLDESQALKSEYQARLDRLIKSEEACVEIRAALGELHDFDENYEEARRHYEAAIEEIDTRAKNSKDAVGGFLLEELPIGRKIGWVVARLRLMLQVGMTYERSRNYERAFTEYRDARALSQQTIFQLLDVAGQRVLSPRWHQKPVEASTSEAPASQRADSPEIQRPNRLETLKQLHILFQPLFASAWVAEKAASTIDSSLNMVEEALADARDSLPLVRAKDTFLPPNTDPTKVSHIQFFLTMANLHHNAGNLYFFKGCHSGEQFTKKDGSPDGLRRDLSGYLPRAAYHYARALVDIRRFTAHRLLSSNERLSAAAPHALASLFPPKVLALASPSFPPAPKVPSRLAPAGSSASLPTQGDSTPSDEPQAELRHPLPSDLWPEFFLRRTATALFGLADVELASVSLNRLLAEEPNDETGGPAARERAEQDEFVEWMSTEAALLKNRAFKLISLPIENVGRTDPPDAANRIVAAESSEWARVRRYLTLSCWGARLLEVGGHYEEAARERVWSAQCVETLAWSLRAFASLPKTRRRPASLRAWVLCLLKEATHALDRASKLIETAAAGSHDLSEPAKPAHAKRIARSLGLLAADSGSAANGALSADFEEVVEALRGIAEDASPATKNETAAGVAKVFRDALTSSLERNAYSMLNHLMTLQVLVLDYALRSSAEDNSAAEHAPVLIEELVRLNAEYASPIHFTPFHYGPAVLLGARKRRHTVKDEQQARRQWLRALGKIVITSPEQQKQMRAAQDELNAALRSGDAELVMLEAATSKAALALARSRETYSGGGAYYETIADLSYLDDDFNDRCFHVHHALQMMGSDLIAALLARIGDAPGDHAPNPDVAEQPAAPGEAA